MRWACKIAVAVAAVLVAFVVYVAVGGLQAVGGQRSVSVIEGLAVAEWDCRDYFWYIYGRLPKKLNIELDDAVKHILDKPTGVFGTPCGFFNISEKLRQWLNNDPVGIEVYERCYGGMFVDAARIYIVVTDHACKEKIAGTIGDLAKQFGTEVVFLKGRYTYKQLIQWADALKDRLYREENGGRLSQMCNYTRAFWANFDVARNLVNIYVQPKCLSPSVVKELAKLVDELEIPREAVLVEDRPEMGALFVVLPCPTRCPC
ncbi:hypothetical protein [Pyrobaculum islandicum]|nr:hypothetical protein [Pyrobaculum islandicum]